MRVKRLFKKQLKIPFKEEAESWNYIVIMYAVMVTTVLALVSAIDIPSHTKAIFIILAPVVLFWLSFFNDPFRNTILGIVTKSQEEVQEEELPAEEHNEQS